MLWISVHPVLVLPMDVSPKWHVTSAAEMSYFFAINMVMEINIKPEYKDYWRGDTVLRDSYVAAIMTRLRYEKLSQYFHCSVEGQKL